MGELCRYVNWVIVSTALKYRGKTRRINVKSYAQRISKSRVKSFVYMLQSDV